MFEIEKDVRIPKIMINRAVHGYGNCRTKYPWKDMDIWDSFVIPLSSYSSFSYSDVDVKHFLQQRILSAGSAYAKNHKGFRFVTRFIDSGVRVWRVPMKYGPGYKKKP